MDMEVCTTLGMLSPEQAQQLKQAGLTAYNHNLDTSREFYPSVITTRKYDERLETIEAVRAAGLSVCSGGIVGLGEKDGDRVGLIWEMSQYVSLATVPIPWVAAPRLTVVRDSCRLPEPPESFPVNALVAIKGTPLEGNQQVTIQELLRTIATARIVLPTSVLALFPLPPCAHMLTAAWSDPLAALSFVSRPAASSTPRLSRPWRSWLAPTPSSR